MIDFLSLKKSVRGLHDQLKALAAEIEGLRREREEMQDAPLPRDDWADLLIESIDAAARDHKARINAGLAASLRASPESLMGQGDRVVAHFLQQGGYLSNGRNPDRATVSVDAIWLLFGDALRGKFREIVMEWDGYPSEVGLSRAERGPALARLDAKIDQLETREAKLLAEAEAAGIRVGD